MILRKEKGSDGYDEECQMKVEERNKAQIKVLNRWTRMNTENYKNKQSKKNVYSKKKSP
jgi:predicted GTPase